MEILFDYGGGIVGGRVTSYLLEKIRVTQPKEGERNFHIFYQVRRAVRRRMRRMRRLADECEYRRG